MTPPNQDAPQGIDTLVQDQRSMMDAEARMRACLGAMGGGGQKSTRSPMPARPANPAAEGGGSTLRAHTPGSPKHQSTALQRSVLQPETHAARGTHSAPPQRRAERMEGVEVVMARNPERTTLRLRELESLLEHETGLRKAAEARLEQAGIGADRLVTQLAGEQRARVLAEREMVSYKADADNQRQAHAQVQLRLQAALAIIKGHNEAVVPRTHVRTRSRCVQQLRAQDRG